MACTLSYPCDNTDARLGRIAWLRERFGYARLYGVGYSDHTRSIRTAALAVAAGATYLEKHFTITPGAGGDHDFALDKPGMTGYVWAAEEAARMLGDDPEAILDSELAARSRARRSLHAVTAIEVGEGLVVGENCLFLRPHAYPDSRPGVGADEWETDHMGEAVRDYEPGEQI